jgi:hypothetical protein
VLDQARVEHGLELAKGLAWLDRAGQEAPLVGQLLALG